MRGGIIRSSFRQISRAYPHKSDAARPSTVRERFGWSRRGLSTHEQKMKLACDELICPVKYLKVEIDFLQSLAKNELIQLAGGARGRSLLAWKAGKTIRTLPELIAKHHARGESVGRALRLDNVGVSRFEGKFGFLDTSEIGPSEQGSLITDWKMGGDLLLQITKLVLGDAPCPRELSSYIALMQSATPKKFRMLFYNSVFLSYRTRFWLKVFIDQRFRKDAESLPRSTRKKIDVFMGKLPHRGEKEDPGSLLGIADLYEVINGAMGTSRIHAQVRAQAKAKEHARSRSPIRKPENIERVHAQAIAYVRSRERAREHARERARSKSRTDDEIQAQPMSQSQIGKPGTSNEPRKPESSDGIGKEEKWRRDSGRWLVSVNRDAVTHGTKTKEEYLRFVTHRMLTAENIMQVLQLEFDDYDQSCIELCDEDESLRVLLGIEEVFWETPDTWQEALEAFQRDVYRAQATDSE